MHAKQVSFTRLHKFVENGVAFTPAQIAAASYSVAVASAGGGAHVYPIAASLLAGTAAQVTVPFSAFGFTPAPGVAYVIQVLVELDGVQSDASKPVTFTNSFTPAAVDSVAVS